ADAVAIADRHGTVTFVNRAWADLHRMTPAEARGHHLSLFHTPDQMAREVQPLLDEVLAGSGRSRHLGHRRKDGSTFVAETSLSPLLDAAGHPAGLLAIAREVPPPAPPIAAGAAGEDELAAVVQGIAHDFNNLLTAVLGNASLALLDLSEGSPARARLVEIERVAQLAHELASRLQARVHGPREATAPAAAPAPERSPAIAPELPAVAPARPGGGMILVVDNEKIVRDVATSILKSHGYSVLTADDGAPAVALYRQRREEVGAVLLDLTMPHMDGREALREIRRFDPQAQVILMTGHLEQDVLSGFADAGLAAFIQKPFRPDELIGTVRRVLAD
ncbi:MAG: response regulator, partial [Acidobacteria bacterium]